MALCGNCFKYSDTTIGSPLNIKRFKEFEQLQYCPTCYPKVVAKRLDEIKITTTNHFEGYEITHYFTVESAEAVVGTGWSSELDASLSDIFGVRSSVFEQKLANAKRHAIYDLRSKAYLLGANGIVGIDIDYVEFSNNIVSAVANGTIVTIEKIEKE